MLLFCPRRRKTGSNGIWRSREIRYRLYFEVLESRETPAVTLAWVTDVGPAGALLGRAMAADPSGNLCVTGNFSGTVDFDPGAGVMNLTSVNSTSDIFVAKYSPAGSLIWARAMGGLASDVGYAIAVDS